MRSEKPPYHAGHKLSVDADQGANYLHLFTEIPIISFERPFENFQNSAKQANEENTSEIHSSQWGGKSISSLDESSMQSHRLLQRENPKVLLEQHKTGLSHPEGPLHRQRIRSICRNLLRKMRLNNPFALGVKEKQMQQFQAKYETAGWEVDERARRCWDILASSVMLLLFLSQTFLLVFQELRESVQIRVIALLGAIVFGGEIGLNLMSVRRERGQKLKALRDIAWTYFTGELWVDLGMFSLLVLQLLTSESGFNQLVVGISVLKVGSLLSKLSNIQRWLLKTEYYERYWSLFKIMLFNLSFAHLIAIALSFMAKSNPGQNWQIVRGISSVWWVQRYIWSYYWATTIMLTVGFGDITPSNYHEAVWVIIIEIVSCIAFSYNISCLGTLIGSIRAQGEQIGKNRKVFENFAEKRSLPEKLTERVLHYIEQSAQVKTRFNIVQEKELIDQLPQSYRTQVLAESNKTLLKSLPFFNQVLLRTVCELSKKLQRKVYFPQETIKDTRSDHHIYILQKGEVGFACRSPGSALDRVYASSIKRTEKQGPFLLSTQFLTFTRNKYDIRSRDYSIIQWMRYEDFRKGLSGFPKDYEYYCFLKDRAKTVLDQYETVPCSHCPQRHTPFTCPRLHFLPLKEHIVHKQLHVRQLDHNKRKKNFKRIARVEVHALRAYHSIQNQRVRLTCLGGISSKSFSRDDRMSSRLMDVQPEGVINQLKTYSLALSKKNNIDQKHAQLMSTIMKLQLRSELRQKRQAQADEVWLLNSDRFEEFSVFFPQNNFRSIIAKQKKTKRGVRSHSIY